MINADDIRLRALEPEDLDLLYRVENDAELWDVGVTNVPYSRFLLHEYIAHASGDIYTDKQVRLIAENSSGEVVGMVDLINFDPRHQRAEVGIVVERRWRRLGYGTAVLALLEHYACHVLHLHQLYVVVAADNAAARQLFCAAGYEQVARLPQWLAADAGFQDAFVMQRLFS
jgi:diamine N-acetyltransferase